MVYLIVPVRGLFFVRKILHGLLLRKNTIRAGEMPVREALILGGAVNES